MYEAVLEVQSACLSLCIPGVSLDHIYSSMLTLLAKQLLQLGVLPHNADHADALKVFTLLTNFSQTPNVHLTCTAIRVGVASIKLIIFLSQCVPSCFILFLLHHSNLSTLLHSPGQSKVLLLNTHVGGVENVRKMWVKDSLEE